MSHRPLSAWITTVPLSADGIARWQPQCDINYGDERTDARALPGFDDGWQRRAITLDIGYPALGLTRNGSGEAVLELDNFARPVQASEGAARIISVVEDTWPDVTVPQADLAVLAGEEVPVRYLLVDRLAAEGDPPPALFHVLPWELVDQLAEQVNAMLSGAAPVQVVVLGHWFTPVGSRFTAALEQLDEGLRDQDAALLRVASTALCSRLLEVDPARLPMSTRMALARIADSLRHTNPFLTYAASKVIGRLTLDEDEDEEQVGQLRLGTRLPAAADTATEIRTESREAYREPFTVRLIVTATGRTQIAVSAALPESLVQQVSDSYAVMLVPIRVTGAAGSTRYLLPLRYSDGRLSGRLDLPVPAGRFVEADIDGPPIGAAEAGFLDAAEVERSIRALRTRSGRALWAQIAEFLPQIHPLRTVIGRETE
jgi:hypothetical protein